MIKQMSLGKNDISALKKGDAVAVISTARKVSLSELDFAITKIKSWGLNVCFGKNLFKKQHQFAGTIKERAEDLQWALDDNNIKAVFFARGGYGSVHVVDYVDWQAFTTNPKWLIGFSDITVFHSHVHQCYNISTLHAAMPITYPQNTDGAIKNIRDILFGENVSYKFEGHSFNKNGAVKAVVVGGNLSILYSLLGSKSQLNTDGKILFLEDLDEYLYHIDRMMQALKRAGMLENLSGLIVGGMNGMNDNSIPFGKTAKEIIRDVVSEYAYPVAFNIPAGHINENLPLLFGEKASFTVATNQVLIGL
jgi:muramoyltetrapeptide carboxypeptidase